MDPSAFPLPPALPRVALVTGGAVRLGRAMVLALSGAGFAVAIHCHRSRAEAEALAQEIQHAGGAAAVVQADLTDESAVQALLPAAVAALGPVGVLVNNASTFERDEWDDADRASWDRHLEPNLRAPFVLMQALARGLPEGAEGAVVNLLDQRVWSLTPHFVSYTVSKAALWALTQQMALALAPRIRVNAIGPGPALPSSRQTPELVRPAMRLRPARARHQPRGGRPRPARHPVPARHDRADDRPGRRAAPAMGRKRRRGRGMTASLASAAQRTRHVFLRDMLLQASIGWYQHEHAAPQRIRVNVDLAVDDESDAPGADSLERVVSYEVVANTVRSIVASGHVKLVETLAERIAEACLRGPARAPGPRPGREAGCVFGRRSRRSSRRACAALRPHRTRHLRIVHGELLTPNVCRDMRS